MKLCYFYTDITLKGGIERVMSLLVSAQVPDKKLDITVVSQYKTFEIPHYPFPEGVRYVYLNNFPYDGSPKSFHRLRLLFRNLGRVKQFFRKNDFDLISSQAFPNAFILFLAGVRMQKVISVEHVYYGYYGKWMRKLRNWIYKKCAAVVVLTQNDKKSFEKDLSNVWVIPNPVLLSARKYSPLENGRVISVGRLEYQKGFDVLIRVFARIHEHFPDWILDIYGEGTLKEELQHQIDDLSLLGIVNLRGTTDRILSEMNKSSFFVMSSRFEGFGMVLVEAMSQGLPCVSFDCPNGPADIIENEQNGLLVPNQDEERLYDAMRLMMENRELRIRLGQEAYKNIEKFDIKKVVVGWKQLYDSLVS